MPPEKHDEYAKLLTEFNKINSRMDMHDERIKYRLDNQDNALEELRKEVKAVNHLVSGNGSPEQGISMRLDRVEQNEKRRAGYMKVVIGACISAVIASVFALIKTLMKP